MSVEFLLPTSERSEVREYGLTADLAKRPLRIGFLANGFPDGEAFLQREAKAIEALLPDVEFRFAHKGNTDQLSSCVSEPLLSELANSVDAVVIGWGHCGSCTSGVTRDAIAFESRGIPSVTLVCDIFSDYATWFEGALGMSGLPKVELPYPVSGTSAENQNAVASKIAPEILSLLARSS